MTPYFSMSNSFAYQLCVYRNYTIVAEKPEFRVSYLHLLECTPFHILSLLFRSIHAKKVRAKNGLPIFG